MAVASRQNCQCTTKPWPAWENTSYSTRHRGCETLLSCMQLLSSIIINFKIWVSIKPQSHLHICALRLSQFIQISRCFFPSLRFWSSTSSPNKRSFIKKTKTCPWLVNKTIARSIIDTTESIFRHTENIKIKILYAAYEMFISGAIWNFSLLLLFTIIYRFFFVPAAFPTVCKK